SRPKPPSGSPTSQVGRGKSILAKPCPPLSVAVTSKWNAPCVRSSVLVCVPPVWSVTVIVSLVALQLMNPAKSKATSVRGGSKRTDTGKGPSHDPPPSGFVKQKTLTRTGLFPGGSTGSSGHIAPI